MHSPHSFPADDYVQRRSGAFDLRSLLHTLLEKIWLIVLCVVLAGFLTAAHAFRSPKIYAANVVVQVEQQEEKVMTKVEKVQQEDLRSLEVLRTIEQTLQSRSLLKRVLETNNLAKDPAFVGLPDTPPSEEQLVTALANMVSVKLRRGTRLIDIVVMHPNPQMTEKIANSLVNQFMVMNYDQFLESSKYANDLLKDKEAEYKLKLKQSELDLQQYKEANQAVSLDDRKNTVQQQLMEITQVASEAKSKRIKLEAEYDAVRKIGTNVDELLVIPAVATDAAVQAIQSKITQLVSAFTALQQRYKPLHPTYQSAKEELDKYREQFAEAVLKVPLTIEAALRAQREAELTLDQAQKAQEKLALELDSKRIKYNELERIYQANRDSYLQVIQRRNDVSLIDNLKSSKIRIVQSASVPERPVKPEKTKMIVRGILAGLFGGILLALGLHALDSSLKTVDEAEEALGLPVLSVVPKIQDLKPDARTLVVAEDAKSPGAEAFRSLRTALSMLGREEDRRTFLFTSALPQEGKTFCTLNYAASLAQQGLRTVLIDGDLRRPAVEEALAGKGKRACGVTDFLTGRKKLDEVIQATSVENFSFIAAGTVAPNPAELLAKHGLDPLIEEALQRYDRVIVDSAPIHAVSDTLLMLRPIQTVCLIVHACKTPRKAVSRAIQVLQQGGAPLAGIIFNRLPRKGRLGYHYDPYYDYSYYGKYAEKGVYGS